MIDWFLGTAYAASNQPASSGNAQWLQLLIFILPIIIFYYFLIHLPQRRRQQEKAKMMNALKRGDEVLLISGLYGKVMSISDQTVSLEIAPKVRVKVTKSSISQITARGEVEEKGEE